MRAAELAFQASCRIAIPLALRRLVEATQSRATQVQAASALVTARFNLQFQRTPMDYYRATSTR